MEIFQEVVSWCYDMWSSGRSGGLVVRACVCEAKCKSGYISHVLVLCRSAAVRAARGESRGITVCAGLLPHHSNGMCRAEREGPKKM